MSRNSFFSQVVTTLMSVAALWCAGPVVAAEESLVTAAEIYGTVSLNIYPNPDGTFTGVLKNNGTQAVRDVRLLVRHSWLWNDERNPGPIESNPARAEYYVVDSEVAAGSELRFRYAPNPPLSQRTDGRFVTTASIVGLTEVGAPQY
jgi:hypothetical protein